MRPTDEQVTRMEFFVDGLMASIAKHGHGLVTGAKIIELTTLRNDIKATRRLAAPPEPEPPPADTCVHSLEGWRLSRDIQAVQTNLTSRSEHIDTVLLEFGGKVDDSFDRVKAELGKRIAANRKLLAAHTKTLCAHHAAQNRMASRLTALEAEVTRLSKVAVEKVDAFGVQVCGVVDKMEARVTKALRSNERATACQLPPNLHNRLIQIEQNARYELRCAVAKLSDRIETFELPPSEEQSQ